MRVINVPIEKLEERYSADWFVWFEDYFNREGIDYITIYPDVESVPTKIESGEFLDVIGTNIFKSAQIQEICRLLKSGELKGSADEVFFFHDLWFPGIEALFYIRNALSLEFKITGVLHAGTYDPHDFLFKSGMRYWGSKIEAAWVAEFDAIFVGTQFHKDLIIKSIDDGFVEDKIHVTYLPVFVDKDKYYKTWDQKKNIVVFPHRLAAEKQPQIFDRVAKSLSHKFPDWQFIKSKDVCSTKDEYYNLLGHSKVSVSCALQETFGIAQQEACLLGCVPIQPYRLSYREIFPKALCYGIHSIESEGTILLKLLSSVLSSCYVDKHSNRVLAETARKQIETKAKEAIPAIVIKGMESLL